jgi:YQGE family putative transporter
MYSALGVIIFVFCRVLFMPLHDIAYFPIQMRIIDVLSVKENRSEFAYIFNHEFGLYAGRFFGLVLFIALAFYVSEEVALRYSLIIVALIQMASIPLARNVIRHTNRTIDEVKRDNPDLQASKLDY